MFPAPESDSNTALLQNLAIRIPCTESWDTMQGDERVRHCGLCKKNVYNLSAMPQAEAAAMLAQNVDGELCVRFYRREDGTVMTSDCSASPRVKLRQAMRTLPRVAAGVAGAAAMAAAVVHSIPKYLDGSRSELSAVHASITPDSLPMGNMTMGAPPAPPMPEQAARALHNGERETAK